MRHSFIKRLDYFFVLRPMLFFPGWITLLAGYFILQRQKVFVSPAQMLRQDFGAISLLLILFALAMGASFLLNQLQDVESDKANEKLFIIAEGHISQRAVLWEIVLLSLLALGLAWFLSLAHFLLTAGFIALTGYMYNYPPFTLKDKPLGSWAANSLMGWFAFALGWTAVKQPGVALVTDALPYVFLNTALYFFTTLPDMEGDRQSQKRTLAVLLGSDFVIRLAFGMFLLSLVTAWLLQDYTLLLIAALSAPFFIRAVWSCAVSDAVRTTKFTILFFAVVICFKLPFFFILMLTGFYATRWYFKQRFNFDYPNFKG